MTRIVLYFLGISLLLLCLDSAAFGRRHANSPQTEPLNLRDFGAVGDGVADDGPSLQSALDALAAAGGGALFIPEGKYSIVSPVEKDFTGLASSITILGVESLTPVAPPSAPGSELSKGLDLHTEIYPRTGEQQVAIYIKGLRSLVVKDIAFVGTATVVTDAAITLLLVDIEKAQIKHSEFYGLATLTGGGIVQAVRSDLEISQCKFLGSTATSGWYIPIVQNLEWYGITVTDTTFLDYGQRPELFSKTGYAAPISWINIGNAAQTSNVSPRREVVLRNVFLDEGAFWGISCLPYRYTPISAPIDLLYITNLEMNVSNLGVFGHQLYDAQHVFIEKSRYGWSHNATAAISLNNIGSAIFDQLKLEADADHILADANTRELTVINSTNVHLDSAAQSTVTINTALDADPVQYIRSRFLAVLNREPDPAAHYYWSDLLVHCLEDLVCQNSTKQALNSYLASNPARTFTITGRITNSNNVSLAGVNVTLSGSQSVSTSTDSDGNYIFTSLPTSGSYSVKPTSSDYVFDSANFVTPSGDQTANFTTKPKTHLVTGTIRSGADPLPGVTVSVSGSATGTTTTDSTGSYSFVLPTDGNYTLTPSKTHYTFGPVATSINDLEVDTQIDFNATLQKHSIAGRVFTVNGTPLAGVVVTLSGSSNSTTNTALDGSYAFLNLDAGANWTISPVNDNYQFSPAAQTFVDLSADATANFEAAKLPVLLTEGDSDRAVALELTQWLPEPFSITTTLLSAGRNTTRVIVFGKDLGLLPGEGIEAITAEAEDINRVRHQLRVEFVSVLQSSPDIRQVVIRLDRGLDGAGEVFITLKVHGLTSNRATMLVGVVDDDPR
ncbi:MAG TPA: carboxypeptidase regulatory-like domain-containing protein [Pyrinomonadaceae bacterium]|nr:carboxypeptidase regulatory-like domain-containing protein [Pyrinomonadaceae bacterium]